MFCGNCGNQIEDNAIFCPICGCRVGSMPEGSDAAQPDDAQEYRQADVGEGAAQSGDPSGYDMGTAQSFQQGYDPGWQQGYNPGWQQQGYDPGWQQGYNPGWQQQGYNQGYPPQGYYPQNGPRKYDGYSVASLVLGILGLFLGPYLVCGILAIVFAHSSTRDHGPNSMSTAGRVLGIIGLVLGGIIWLIAALVMSWWW